MYTKGNNITVPIKSHTNLTSQPEAILYTDYVSYATGISSAMNVMNVLGQ